MGRLGLNCWRAGGSEITPRRASFSSAARQFISLSRPRQSFHPSHCATRRDSSARLSSGSPATLSRIRSNTSSENSRPHIHMATIVLENGASVQPPDVGYA